MYLSTFVVAMSTWGAISSVRPLPLPIPVICNFDQFVRSIACLVVLTQNQIGGLVDSRFILNNEVK